MVESDTEEEEGDGAVRRPVERKEGNGGVVAVASRFPAVHYEDVEDDTAEVAAVAAAVAARTAAEAGP